MRRFLLVIVAVACMALPAAAKPKATAKQCKALCGATIKACVDQGGKRTKCKKKVIGTCKRTGVVACTPPSSGAFTVATTGSDAAGCGTTTAPCQTIQYVVTSLIPLGGSGTIKVAAGTYDTVAPCLPGATSDQAVVCILNRQITLRGGFSTADWETPGNDANVTVLDGHGVGRGVRILRTGPSEPAAALVMEGFTVRNGLAKGASSGGTDKTWAFGGGLLAEYGTLTLKNLVFSQNRAIGGSVSDAQGGRGAGGAIAINGSAGSASTLEDLRFEGNQAIAGTGTSMGGYALGGGLFTFESQVTGDRLVFTGNSATAGSSNGSGTSGGELADALGGAVAIEEGSQATLRHVQASGNTATGGNAPNGMGGGGFAGGVFGELADLTLSDSIVEGNTAQGGTGKNVGGGSIAEGGGIHTTASNLIVERSIVSGNSALGGDGQSSSGASVGGGIAVINNSDGGSMNKQFTLRNVIVAHNSVDVGAGNFVGGGAGGLWVQAASGTVEHVTLAGNRLLDNRLVGAGMTLISQSGWQTHVVMKNTIVADHTDPASHPASWSNAAVWVGQGCQADLTRTLFANNVHDSNAGVSGGLNLPPGVVNLSATLTALSAGFVAPGAPSYDYHILGTSPAIDQAVASGVTDDVDGEARPQGAASDIGADEHAP